MKRQSLFYLCLTLIVGIGLLYSCTKKEIARTELAPDKDRTMEVIKQEFVAAGLQAKLENKFNDTATVHWAPVWNRYSMRKVSDSVTYYYVPLTTYLTVRNGRLLPVRTLMTEPYLVIKQRSQQQSQFKFVKATYTQKAEQQDGKPVFKNPDYDHFTGYLALDDLTGTRTLHRYKNSVLVDNTGASNPGGRIVCDMECNWFSYCTGADIGSGQYTVTVSYGRMGEPCEYPLTPFPDCGFAGATPSPWILSYSNEFNCQVIDDDPPPPPGGGDGSTSTEDGVEFSPLLPVTITPAQTKKIENIRSYLKCFEDGKPAREYKVSIYAEPPGSGGVYDANPITKTIESVGHTFVTFTKTNTDGTQVNQTIGWYPDQTTDFRNPVPGHLYDDGGHGYTIRVDVPVDITLFNFALNYVADVAENQQYSLVDNNCTDFVVGVGMHIGLNIPTGYRNWGSYQGQNYGGACPAGLAEDMDGWTPNTGVVAKPNRAFPAAISSKGPCP
ncbi:hypothetical protein J2T02_002573 [Chitinophaga terrae (ex Kim and Jung 2007)]|uniref:hypothetical protein n=1 Tax=Chitinophaga terrae (ex Kim and Jung 2007) TaxID=408074 RepID=UPI00278B67D1|nr:hypothetical protein [Chitinophaga terrae (ex Kim and Jung 2007)]MDQ0107454.1 hypothetical protein [Chitinophaga terrae (ex Kim and Jung 2007)]